MNRKPSSQHPCFDADAKHTQARVHLPVAPKCNVQCNYCNRKYDCVNESRPGVASALLTPHQALAYVKELDTKIDNLSVIGIAGPGDPFANPDETLLTLRLIKKEFPDKKFCVSSNGLNLLPYIENICDIGVTHVTLTINAVDPEISSKIYAWVKDDFTIYRGQQAARLLLNRQLEALSLLKDRGITVKINSVIILGINDHHIQEIAACVPNLGADVMNAIPLLPNQNTPFANLTEPNQQLISAIRDSCTEFIPAMTHCKRCRADAVGILGYDNLNIMDRLNHYSQLKIEDPNAKNLFVAVATSDMLMVDQHLGQATAFHVFEQSKFGFELVEVRQSPAVGQSDLRWMRLAKLLGDCKAVVVVKAGPNPQFILEKAGLKVIQFKGLTDQALQMAFNNVDLVQPAISDFKCGSGCNGAADGCK